MLYILFFLAVLAIWAVSYAITSPDKIQNMLIMGETESPEAILDKMSALDKAYLLTSSAPFLIIPLLFFTELPRSTIYAGVLIVLTVVGLLFKEQITRDGKLIRIECTIELIIYCDLIRNGIYEIWG